MRRDVRPFRASRHQLEVLVASWQDAEELAVWHMREILAFRDAVQTRGGPDGGLDVQAMSAVAQVKHHSSPVGAPDVQRLVGAGFAVEVKLFYAQEGFTPAAIAYAESAGVCLFTYDIYGAIVPVGAHASALLSSRRRVQEEPSARSSVECFEQTMADLNLLVDALERAFRKVEVLKATDIPAVYVCAEIAVQLAKMQDARSASGVSTYELEALDDDVVHAVMKGDSTPSRWVRRLHDWDLKRARLLAKDPHGSGVSSDRVPESVGAIQRWPHSVGADMSYLGWYVWPQKRWLTQAVAERLVQLDPLHRGSKWCRGAMWHVNKELAWGHEDLNIRFYDELIPDVGGWRQLLQLDE